MKFIKLILLILYVMPFACQNTGQRAYKDDAVPTDLTSDNSNDSQEDTVLSYLTSAMNNDSYGEPEYPDSVEISLILPQFGRNFLFSINHDKESSIEIYSISSSKEILSRAYSDQILKRISNIFLYHKAPVIIAKKYIPDKIVISELPRIKFIIYNENKAVETEYFIVGERQGHYEITYSNYFLILYNLLCTKAKALYELKQ